MIPFFVTIPHSGERIPPEASWLFRHDETLMLRDIDRFVDRLYEPSLEQFKIPFVKTEWHRYAIDLNRFETDVDEETVEGASAKSGAFTRGLHWKLTTYNEVIFEEPLSQALHEELVKKYFSPFHENVKSLYGKFKAAGAERVFHLDAHSMPSRGTNQHRDPGEDRADIVVSDFHGKSCDPRFRELVVNAYEKAGFKVAVNWPYFGGGVTQAYGKPEIGQHAIQVELNRKLYMDESTKKESSEFLGTQSMIRLALQTIYNGVSSL